MRPDAIERTVQKTHLWLHGICTDLRTQDEQIGYHALRAVLHAIRDRLSVEEAAAFGAQLPLLVRGIYYEGWHAHGKPRHLRKAEEFLKLVGENLAHDTENPFDARRALDAVIGTLQAHVDAGALAKLSASMPPEIRTLFAGRMSARPGH